jgi:cell division protein FtsB
MKIFKYLIFIGTAVFLLTNSDFRNLVRNYFKLHELKKQDARLDREYAKMQKEKELLNENEYLEELARCRLNMIKPDEYEFRFTPPSRKDEN